MRVGLIGKKLGMTRLFSEDGLCIPVTVVKVDPCVVVDKKTKQKSGYDALQLGSVSVSASRLKKPQRGYFAKKNLEPFKLLKEFRVSSDNMLEQGDQIGVTHFKQGQFVDATAISIGKGFAGGIKRHHYHGLRASHGVSVSHRSCGSTGNCQDPGRVWKGKKMPGRMGGKRVTTLNLFLHSIDEKNNVLFVRGAIPGSKNSIVYIRDAIKKQENKQENKRGSK